MEELRVEVGIEPDRARHVDSDALERFEELAVLALGLGELGLQLAQFGLDLGILRAQPADHFQDLRVAELALGCARLAERVFPVGQDALDLGVGLGRGREVALEVRG